MRKISTGVIIAIAATGLFMTLLTSGLLMSSQSLQSSGTVTAVNVGVYSDSSCTQNCTSIAWGTIAPGNSSTRTIYVKNIGTVPMTLSMTMGSWVPSNMNTYLSLSWNRGGTVLSAGQSTTATLTLSASSSAGNITSFSFNIIITGTES
jgi:alkyl sulfatase BDS1-like metallo-beta-lactamase superfamily hydrolase